MLNKLRSIIVISSLIFIAGQIIAQKITISMPTNMVYFVKKEDGKIDSLTNRLLDIGKAELKWGHYEKSRQLFAKFTNYNPKDYRGYYWMSWTYLLENDPTNARKYAQKSIQKDKNREQSEFLLGMTYYAQKKHKDAKKNFDAVINKNPDNFLANRMRGLFYYNDKDYKQAAKLFRRNIEVSSNLAFEHYYLGMSYYRLNMRDEAMRELDRAARLAPNTQLGKDALFKGAAIWLLEERVK